MAEIPKKISELPQIQNISIDDLLLVSDYDNGKCLSRKMTMQQLVQYVVNAVASSSSVKQQIKQQATTAAQSAAQTTAQQVAANIAAQQANIVANQVVNDKTMQIVEANIEDIYDMLDGVKNNEFLIDSGGSGV